PPGWPSGLGSPSALQCLALICSAMPCGISWIRVCGVVSRRNLLGRDPREDLLVSSFPSYHLDALLYDSASTMVYRAPLASDHHPVVLKVLRETAPERLAAFKREYDLLRTLNLPGVVRAYGLEHEADSWILVLEDFGGESLARLQLAGRLAIADFLQLALAVSESLRQGPQQHVIHKHNNPGNILLNPSTGALQLTHFGTSSGPAR